MKADLDEIIRRMSTLGVEECSAGIMIDDGKVVVAWISHDNEAVREFFRFHCTQSRSLSDGEYVVKRHGNDISVTNIEDMLDRPVMKQTEGKIAQNMAKSAPDGTIMITFLEHVFSKVRLGYHAILKFENGMRYCFDLETDGTEITALTLDVFSARHVVVTRALRTFQRMAGNPAIFSLAGEGGEALVYTSRNASNADQMPFLSAIDVALRDMIRKAIAANPDFTADLQPVLDAPAILTCFIRTDSCVQATYLGLNKNAA